MSTDETTAPARRPNRHVRRWLRRQEKAEVRRLKAEKAARDRWLKGIANHG